jgi:DamX protein
VSTEDTTPEFNPDYWQAYTFTANPFAPQAEPQPHFIAQTWKEYLDLFPQFARFCNALVIISGETGIGKTSLIKQFMQDHAEEAQIAYITAEECNSLQALVEIVHTQFQAPFDAENPETLNEKLQSQLAHLKENKAPRLLVIDNAEKLPLNMRLACLQLTQQQSEVETGLPIMLIGTAEIPQQFHALLTPKTAEECLHLIEQQALTQEEMGNYLAFACEQVGGDKEQTYFTPEDIETIYNSSKGVFDATNNAAGNLLSLKAAQQPKVKPKKSWLRRLIWWSSILIVIVGLMFLYKYLTQPADLGTTFTKPLSMRDNAKPALSSKQVGDLLIHNTPAAHQDEPPVPFVSKNLELVVPKPSPKLIAVHKTKPLQIVIPELKQAEKASATTKLAAPKKTATKSTGKKKDTFSGVMNEKVAMQMREINKVSSRKYTLQFVATDDVKSAQAFIARYQLQDSAKIVRIHHAKKMWYNVIYGDFPNAATAKKARAKLPATLRKLSPWPRSYGSVQEAMQKK